MSVHDWTRVFAGIFHDFHHSWIEEIKRALNSGLLPSGYYALAEQISGDFGPDVLTLEYGALGLDGDGTGSGPSEANSSGATVLTATLAPPGSPSRSLCLS